MTPSLNRRWSRFSLRTLFVVVMVLCAGLAWAAWNVNRVKQRQELLESLASRYAIRGLGDEFPHKPPRQMPIGLRLFGAKRLNKVLLVDGLYFDEDVSRLAILYPETRIYHASPDDWQDTKGVPVNSSAD
jgi:hypothetical protein